MKSLTVKANAKINTYLDIQSIRPDNYHNILSVMQSVTLCDVITIEYENVKEKNIYITCSDNTVPTNEKNTAYKAAMYFPCTGNIKIHIEKKIPHEAGLGGGSADAAAVLAGLNALSGLNLSEKELIDIGFLIGADVPFCISGGAKLIQGIGEVTDEMPLMCNLPMVIAMWGEGMSTPQAYKALDEKFDNFSGYSPRIHNLELLKNNDLNVWKQGMYNIFEEVVLHARPLVGTLKQKMIESGSLASMMSGSGASVFGIFNNKSDAEEAAENLRTMGADVNICFPTSEPYVFC